LEEISHFMLTLLKLCWRIACWLFWKGLGLFGLGLLGWYALRWWLGDHFLPVRLFNYFMPWLLVGLLPALVVAGLARHKWVALALAAPTLVIGLTFAPLFLPRPESVLAAILPLGRVSCVTCQVSGNNFHTTNGALQGQETTPLKVMSYNVWYRNENVAAMTGLIRREQPDILLLQELSPAMVRRLKDELVDLYPEGQLHLAYEPEVYQGIISRYRLTPVDFAYDKGRTQRVMVATPGGPIAVWNVHPNTPLSWPRQYWQLSALTDDIATTDGPLIVGGDFNTTDQSETYQLINQYLQNAHWEAGWGFGFTFPAHQPRFREIPILTPVIRIDHIFYSPHFFAHNARTLTESGGSDHLPVTAELSWVR
jgi:vancomycin resistance protein VanJ